jgi:hypothetical protein
MKYFFLLEQHKTKAQNRSLSQKQGKAQRDSVQVHNWYGYMEDEPVWNLPPNDSPSPIDESPSDTRRSPKVIRLNGPNGSKVFPRSSSITGSSSIYPYQLWTWTESLCALPCFCDRLRFWALVLCCSFLFWCEVELELVDDCNVESEVGVVRDEDVVVWE